MLVQRLRRCSNIKPALGQMFEFAGYMTNNTFKYFFNKCNKKMFLQRDALERQESVFMT